MKIFVLMVLFSIGCGSSYWKDGLSNREKFLLPKMSQYFGMDLTDLFYGTRVLENVRCENLAFGCYKNGTIILMDDFSFNPPVGCQTLAHEYIHAFSDKYFGDSDVSHERFSVAYFDAVYDWCEL